MNTKKLALFYIGIISLQLAHVTFAQGGPGGGGGGGGGGNEEPGTDGKGGHLDKQKENDKDPNHWKSKKFIYRCAHGSTMTGVLPNFPVGASNEDGNDLFLKHVSCSKVNKHVADIPVHCDWYPTICPENTVYIRGIRKEVNDTIHYEWGCCVNNLACSTQCQQKKQVIQSDQKVFFFPEQQTDSDQVAGSITSIMIHDVDGHVVIEWKFCLNTTICYTPPPGPHSPPGDCWGCLGLLGLLGLLALGKPSSSSAAPTASSTAAG